MAKRRVPARAIDSPGRIRSRPYESDWARLPRDEVWDRTTPGAGPWGSVDGPRSKPTMTFVAGYGVLLLGIFLMAPAVLGVGAALMVVGAVWGIVVVRRRRGSRATLLWGGIGTKDIGRKDTADQQPA